MTVGVFFIVFFGTIAAGRFLKRRAGVRLGLFYKLFCLALGFHAAAHVYGVQTTWRGHLGAAVVLLRTALTIALLDRYVWDYYYETRRQVVIPRLLREFTAAVVLLVMLLLVLSIGYHAETELKGILAGSGVIAIILGFGMQNLLKTLVAGASLQIGKPYRLGDWLRIGEHIGQVVEINWADTRLRTNDAVSIEIPNNKIVEDTIVDLSFPTTLHAMRLSVGADYNVPPNRVKDALRRAASNAEGIVLDPPPKVFLKEFADSAIVYEVKFWMNSHATYNDLCDAIHTNIWYESKGRESISLFRCAHSSWNAKRLLRLSRDIKKRREYCAPSRCSRVSMTSRPRRSCAIRRSISSAAVKLSSKKGPRVIRCSSCFVARRRSR